MSTIVTRAVKGSALTWTEGDANFTNLNNDKIEDIVEDTTPQLGGNLDVNGNSIVSTSNGNIAIAPNGTGDVQLNADTIRVGDHNSDVTISSYGTGNLTLNTHTGTNSGIIRINQGNNGNIEITPNGTGSVVLDGLSYPQADGTANQVLKTNGSGVLGFVTITQATGNELENVVEDTTPQLGGDLDVGTHSIITSVEDGDITIAPDGAGIVSIVSDLEVGYGTGTAAITSAGAHNLDLVTNSGTDSGLIRIVDGANGNIQIEPNGTGKSVVSAINYNEGAIHTVTYASTITPNVTNGNVQTVTLTGNVTFNAFASPVAGQSLTLKVVQDATGSRLLTSTMKFAGASKTLSTAANSIDIISVYYDGTNYFASLAKGFA
jgi:hypothetical protein